MTLVLYARSRGLRKTTKWHSLIGGGGSVLKNQLVLLQRNFIWTMLVLDPE